jgi:hypothetical protein
MKRKSLRSVGRPPTADARRAAAPTLAAHPCTSRPRRTATLAAPAHHPCPPAQPRQLGEGEAEAAAPASAGTMVPLRCAPHPPRPVSPALLPPRHGKAPASRTTRSPLVPAVTRPATAIPTPTSPPVHLPITTTIHSCSSSISSRTTSARRPRLAPPRAPGAHAPTPARPSVGRRPAPPRPPLAPTAAPRLPGAS